MSTSRSFDEWKRLAQEKFDRKTKPLGSLGHLEELAARLAAIQQTLSPTVHRKRLSVYAASHGIVAEGVSAYPAEVTAQMVLNFLNGGAAINVLARHGGIELNIVNVGVDRDLTNVASPNFSNQPIQRGTRNFLREQAMSLGELQRAMNIGREHTQAAKESGVELLGIGEMGIGNTTSAAALFSALLGVSAEESVGRGTGLDDAGVQRKARVVHQAVTWHRATCCSAEEWMQAVGGFEIAAMCGSILEAHRLRLPIVVDGFVATAAAAVAFAIDPSSKQTCFFAHSSAEKAHALVLKHLNVTPILALEMRLGEGTGAALAMHILDAAARLLCEMATFESAGVSESPQT